MKNAQAVEVCDRLEDLFESDANIRFADSVGVDLRDGTPHVEIAQPVKSITTRKR